VPPVRQLAGRCATSPIGREIGGLVDAYISFMYVSIDDAAASTPNGAPSACRRTARLADRIA
jgi:hypothetical protein